MKVKLVTYVFLCLFLVIGGCSYNPPKPSQYKYSLPRYPGEPKRENCDPLVRRIPGYGDQADKEELLWGCY